MRQPFVCSTIIGKKLNDWYTCNNVCIYIISNNYLYIIYNRIYIINDKLCLKAKKKKSNNNWLCSMVCWFRRR